MTNPRLLGAQDVERSSARKWMFFNIWTSRCLSVVHSTTRSTLPHSTTSPSLVKVILQTPMGLQRCRIPISSMKIVAGCLLVTKTTTMVTRVHSAQLLPVLQSSLSTTRHVVFQSPVATEWKNWQPNQTATNLDWTAVASPRGCAIHLVVVAVAWEKIKDRLQPVATGLSHNQFKLGSNRKT